MCVKSDEELQPRDMNIHQVKTKEDLDFSQKVVYCLVHVTPANQGSQENKLK